MGGQGAVGARSWTNSSRSANRFTGFTDEFVSIDHSPPSLLKRLETMASLHSPPLYSRKRVMRLPAVSFTTVEDDPNVPPVLQLSTQLLVPVQTGTAHDKDEHAYVLTSRSFEVIGPAPDRSIIGSPDRPAAAATAESSARVPWRS
jgi:hypothetical protein